MPLSQYKEMIEDVSAAIAGMDLEAKPTTTVTTTTLLTIVSTTRSTVPPTTQKVTNLQRGQGNPASKPFMFYFCKRKLPLFWLTKF